MVGLRWNLSALSPVSGATTFCGWARHFCSVRPRAVLQLRLHLCDKGTWQNAERCNRGPESRSDTILRNYAALCIIMTVNSEKTPNLHHAKSLTQLINGLIND
ncbi:hypothetical protein VTJ04DRAFT_5342 [Mycothermus thermophilus]|uniref:uncharacterized protein n=1 Tax=Humicola insolens TaxID=85995 RepID=UPI0037430400